MLFCESGIIVISGGKRVERLLTRNRFLSSARTFKLTFAGFLFTSLPLHEGEALWRAFSSFAGNFRFKDLDKTDTVDSSEPVSILLSKTVSSKQRRGVLGREGGRGVTGRVKRNPFLFDILLVQSRYGLKRKQGWEYETHENNSDWLKIPASMFLASHWPFCIQTQSSPAACNHT